MKFLKDIPETLYHNWKGMGQRKHLYMKVEGTLASVVYLQKLVGRAVDAVRRRHHRAEGRAGTGGGGGSTDSKPPLG